MITVPPPSSCPTSPTSVTLMLRIRLRRKVRLQVSRLIISQRLGILNTLIQRCTRTMKAKKNAQREAIAVKLAHRMVHLLYVWDRDDQSWMLRAGRYLDSNTVRS